MLFAHSNNELVVVTDRSYTNQSKWGMAGLNGLVIMGQRSSIDWLCVSKWCREVEGSTTYFYRRL